MEMGETAVVLRGSVMMGNWASEFGLKIIIYGCSRGFFPLHTIDSIREKEKELVERRSGREGDQGGKIMDPTA